MPTQDDTPLAVTVAERTHPAYVRLARACITLARLSCTHVKPPEGEVEPTPDGASQ